MNIQTKHQPYSLADIRHRIETRLPDYHPDEHDGDYSRNPDYREYVVSNATKPAAVLIPFVVRNGETHVVLTKRTEKLKSHSGQIAFPGGRVDPEDPNEEHAALREAQEEIGLDFTQAEVLGRMPDYYSGSGFKIVPVLAEVQDEATFVANPDEVDYIFEVPMGFLMDPANHIEASRMFQGTRRYYLEMPYEDHYIWGVTAGIIRVVYDRLYA